MKTGSILAIVARLVWVLPFLSACGGAGSDGGFGGISLSARASGATSITLSWSEPRNGFSVSPYIVARNDDYSSSSIGSTTDRRYDVFGLSPSTQYCFVIRNPVTRNTMSNTACATTSADTTSPTRPNGLTATAVSPAQIDLVWDNSSDNDRVASYNIFRDGTLLRSVSPSAVSDTDALPATEYCYEVSAVDAAGNESARSAESCATTPPDTEVPTVPSDSEDPTLPSGVDATYSESSGQPTIRLAWGASSDDGLIRFYRIFRNGDYLADSPDTTYDDSDLQPDTGYCYTVLAVDAAGKESGRSEPGCARVGWAKQALGARYVPEASIVTDSSNIPNIVYKSGSSSSGNGLYRIRLQTGVVPGSELLEQGLEPSFPQDAFRHAVAIDDSDLLHIAHKFNPELFDEEVQYLQVSSGPPISGTIVQGTDSFQGISLAVDSTGAVHACYSLGYSLHYATNTSGAWVSVETASLVPGADGNSCDIAVDASGNMHISYLDAQGLAYLSDRSGTWVAESLDVQSSTSTRVWLPRTSIDVDAIGAAHIAFFHDATDGLEYATNVSGDWVTSTVDTGGNVGSDCELALDGDGNAHIVYLDTTDVALLKYASNRSGSWEAGFLSDASAWFASISIDALGAAHVVYADTAGFLTYITNAD